MNKKVLAACVVVILLFVAAYLASPFWAARQFKEAALSADVDHLDAAVDFPSVRESLKSQLTVAVTTKMNNDPAMRSNPFAGLGTVMIPALVGKMVDGFVTPDGISAMVKQGKVEKRGGEVKSNPNIRYSYDYRSLDRFSVTVKVPDAKEDQAPKFIFERRGLFSWKVIRLEIPEKMLAQ